MHRPIPGVFQGSVPSEVNDRQLCSIIERTLGGAALLLAFGAYGLTVSLSGQTSWLAVGVGCAVLLVMSALGLWLRHAAAEAPFVDTAGIYRSVLRRMSFEGGMRHAAAEGGHAGLAGLVGDLALLLRRTQARRASLETTLIEGRGSLRAGREQAQRVAGEIQQQLDVLSAAACTVNATDAQLVREAATTAQSLEATGTAVARAMDGIAAIAGSVRATSAGALRMSETAAQVADVAHNAHRCIADLDDRTAKIVLALDTIERALQLAASVGQAGSIREDGEDASALATPRLASELQAVAGQCQPALLQAGEAIRELVAQTAEANRRTMEIAELVGATHDIGQTVSRAVEEQGQQIARVLTELYEARPGFATLRAGVEAVMQSCADRTGSGDVIRNTANALPRQAEHLARILRGLPDLTPPAE